MLCIEEIDVDSTELHRTFDDALGDLTTYGRYLLQLGEFHELLILNNISYFLDSIHFTCLPHGRGLNVVDYVMTN